MDRIYIRDLALRCIIGIFPHERKNKQDILLNITLDCDPFSAAAASDDIADAVDYKSLCKKIIALIEPSEFQLILSLQPFVMAGEVLARTTSHVTCHMSSVVTLKAFMITLHLPRSS